MFYNYVKQLIERSDSISQNNLQFGGPNLTSLSKGFPSTYLGLDVQFSFGKGNWANTTWIAFLGYGQAITNGIYPVFLYYREIKVLILAYGVSATNTPTINWSLKNPITTKDYFKRNKIHVSNKYEGSFVYKVYQSDAINPSIDNDIADIITEYKQFMNGMASTSTPTHSSNAATTNTQPADLIKSTIQTIKNSGLLYSDNLIKRFVLSLMTKPFVILSGLSGSGKTQLAIAFAKAMSENFDKQVRIVPVGADWTNREPLLGYPNALEKDSYVHPDSGVLQLMLDANTHHDKPFFLILDEMNLSYVERYFADFLSALESHSDIPLWNKATQDTPKQIGLPKNLFIIGTINVDETTYMFSPKVLDRANVIEFKINTDEMKQYFTSSPSVDIGSIKGDLANYANIFLSKSLTSTFSAYTKTEDKLLEFFNALKTVNAEFGYRSASEIGRFMALAEDFNVLTEDEALDAAIVQKMLPKLHGSRKKVVPVLKTLWKCCGITDDLEEKPTLPDSTTYPLSADKILRMYNSAIDNGFTSFAEA